MEESLADQKKPRARLSCAECRRLKLKCSRDWPCSNCIKRGCQELCPDDVMKQAKPSVQEFKALVSRIHELEEKLSRYERPSRKDSIVEDQRNEADSFSPIDAAGVLEWRGLDAYSYFGPSAGEAFLDSTEEMSRTREEDEANITGVTPLTWPLLMHGHKRLAEYHHLKNHLPEKEEALNLVETYYASVAYQWEPIQKNEFYTKVWPLFYPPKLQSGDWSGRENSEKQNLALLYIILALGTLFSPKFPFRHPNAGKYYVLSQQALISSNFIIEPTLAALQALHIHASYMLNTHRQAAEEIYPLLGVAIRTAVSMGLHRDGLRWNLPQPELDSRRILFWECESSGASLILALSSLSEHCCSRYSDLWISATVLAFERITAFVLGRPKALSDLSHDTCFPSKETLELSHSSSDENLTHANSEFHFSKWKLCRIIGIVSDRVFSISVPPYEAVLKLDLEIRGFLLSMSDLVKYQRPNVKPVVPPSDVATELALKQPAFVRSQMQRHALAVMSSESQLFLHRPFFTYALQHPSHEPLLSTSAKSVLCVCLEACPTLISIARDALALYPHRASRLWSIFFHAYGAGVCQASLLLNCPKSLLAEKCWQNLCDAACLLKIAASEGVLAKELHPRLLKYQKYVLELLCQAYQMPLSERSELFEVDAYGAVTRKETSGVSGQVGLNELGQPTTFKFPFVKDSTNIPADTLETAKTFDASIADDIPESAFRSPGQSLWTDVSTPLTGTDKASTSREAPMGLSTMYPQPSPSATPDQGSSRLPVPGTGYGNPSINSSQYMDYQSQGMQPSTAAVGAAKSPFSEWHSQTAARSRGSSEESSSDISRKVRKLGTPEIVEPMYSYMENSDAYRPIVDPWLGQNKENSAKAGNNAQSFPLSLSFAFPSYLPQYTSQDSLPSLVNASNTGLEPTVPIPTNFEGKRGNSDIRSQSLQEDQQQNQGPSISIPTEFDDGQGQDSQFFGDFFTARGDADDVFLPDPRASMDVSFYDNIYNTIRRQSDLELGNV